MSHTDKTDPYKVKKARLPETANIYWRPEFRCCCKLCTDPNLEPRTVRHREKRIWQKEAEQEVGES